MKDERSLTMTPYSDDDADDNLRMSRAPETNLTEVAHLACALQQIHVSRERYHAVVGRQHKLSTSELSCLCYLHVDGPQPPNRLAGLLGVTPSAITSMVGTLVRRGLANRSDHPTDRRISVVAPTAAGSAIIRTMASRLAGCINSLAVNAAAATAVLTQISAALDACVDDSAIAEN